MSDSADLPAGWTGGNTYGENRPNGIIPDLVNPWARTVNTGGWLQSPRFKTHAGQQVKVTLISAYWDTNASRSISVVIEYAGGDKQKVGRTNPSQCQPRSWVTTTLTATFDRDSYAHISILGGGSASHLAYVAVTDVD